MGYSSSAITRIIDKAALFRGKKIVTLGTLYPFVNSREARDLLKNGVNTGVPKENFSRHLFIDTLSALTCKSLDVSDYQESEIICNLNLPVPKELHNQFDVVVDAGTLEHLSNLSTALENLFNILSVDGIYYFSVPCNNWVDHGFFQFSPTFFVDLCKENPSLELVELCISTANAYHDISKINPFFKIALTRSSERLIVTGIIKKKGASLNLNLMQSKYTNEYAKNPINSKKKSAINQCLYLSLLWLARNNAIPLRLKKSFFDFVYRLKKSTH